MPRCASPARALVVGGGGLPDFGLFANEQIYTVFLDMRERARHKARQILASFWPKNWKRKHAHG